MRATAISANSVHISRGWHGSSEVQWTEAAQSSFWLLYQPFLFAWTKQTSPTCLVSRKTHGLHWGNCYSCLEILMSGLPKVEGKKKKKNHAHNPLPSALNGLLTTLRWKFRRWIKMIVQKKKKKSDKFSLELSVAILYLSISLKVRTNRAALYFRGNSLDRTGSECCLLTQPTISTRGKAFVVGSTDRCGRMLHCFFRYFHKNQTWQKQEAAGDWGWAKLSSESRSL